MTIYNAVNTELIEGNEKEFYILGSYSSKEKALEALEEQYYVDMLLYDEDDIEKFTRSENLYGFTVHNGCSVYEYAIYERILDDKAE